MKSKPPAADPRRAEFEALYQRHGREVWALAYARWMDADAALDIAQEAFLRLWRHWEAGAEDLQNPRAWLLRVARNLAEDYAKSAFRRNGTTPPQIMNGVKSRDPQPLDDMERAEAFAAIRATLEELPTGDRDLLVSPQSLRGLLDGLPNARSIGLAGDGHLAFATRPERVACAVRKFLLEE